MYAREGFGAFVAFIVAWGYWLMTIFSNVAFAIMIMDVLNYFIPGDFSGGNNIASIVGVSILVWGFNFLVLSGTCLAGTINVIGTFAKMIPLIIFVIIVVYYLNYEQLTSNIWGHNSLQPSKDLGPITTQIFSPLNVALWCFIGVEGEVALSGRAKNKKDVGKATFIGFMVSLIICILVSVLPFGILPQKELSTIPTPSTAGILKILTGDWGEYLINIGVLISVLTSWLAMLNISALTVLPAYLMSTAYLFKICITKEFKRYTTESQKNAFITSLIGILFCIFMFYASDIKYLTMVPILLTIGLPLFVFSHNQKNNNTVIFSKYEKYILYTLIIIDFIVLYLVFSNKIQL